MSKSAWQKDEADSKRQASKDENHVKAAKDNRICASQKYKEIMKGNF